MAFPQMASNVGQRDHLGQSASHSQSMIQEMSSTDPFYDTFPLESCEDWEPFDFLQVPDTDTVHAADSPPIPSSTEPVENTLEIANQNTPSSQLSCGQQASQADKLGLVQLNNWDEEKTYDEDPPSCIHYSIEWKVTLNSKVITKDTEQDLVLAPASYWRLVLQPKLEKLLRRKTSQNKCARSDDTNVVVSVADRSQRDLTKRFEDTDIDWSIVERQLVAWGELFRSGKKLRVDLSFNYVETGQQSTQSSSRKGDKRGSSSGTNRRAPISPESSSTEYEIIDSRFCRTIEQASLSCLKA
jgi:hypothetical protein